MTNIPLIEVEKTLERSIGQDWGNGQTNIDVKTGIRYGVIHHGKVGQSWYEASEGFYKYYCPHCGHELPKGAEARRCGSCWKCIDPDRDFDCLDPIAHIYKGDSYKAEQSFDDCDIFIFKSPYFTLCAFCSPCAPGAGYLLDQRANGIKAYCFGHDWFEGNRAPYRVFDVTTGKEVLP